MIRPTVQNDSLTKNYITDVAFVATQGWYIGDPMGRIRSIDLRNYAA